MKKYLLLIASPCSLLNNASARTKWIRTVLSATFLLLMMGQPAFSQTITVKGKITSNNEPLLGVNVTVKGTTTSTMTNDAGAFTIVAPSNGTLLLTFVGFGSKEVPIQGRTFIVDSLVSRSSQLTDVVVVGYGQQKKVTLTGAIATVSGDDLIRAPVAGVSNALIGLAPGMQAIQSSGEFGSDKADIRIRGIATLNTGGAGPLILVDGVERETFNNIDAHEIETINILKDAASTAVFGVRGANGVIIITTKQGKAGKLKMELSSNAAMSQPTILPKLLNAYDFAVLHNEANKNQGNPVSFTDEDIRLYKTGEDPIFHGNHDWVNELIKPWSFQQSHNLNMSGGSEKLRYFTSVGYFSQSGAYRKPQQGFGFPFKHEYNRYNIRMNFDFNFTNDFSMSVKLGEQIMDNSIPNGGAWGAFDKANTTSPVIGPAFVDGKYIESIKGQPAGVPFLNPWGQAGPTSTGGAFITDQFSNVLNTNLSLRYKLDKITPGLSVRAMGAYDSYYLKAASRQKNFAAWTIQKDPNDPAKTIMYQSKDDGPWYNLSESVAENQKWRKIYAEAAIEYNRTFGGAHRVGGLVLGNLQKLHDPSLDRKLPAGLLGLVGRVTYDYKGRYLTEVNVGYNGSENFPEDQRFGLFPAFSLGWVATEEPFFPETNWISFLKIRGSYGEVGNDKIGGARYLYLDGPYALSTGGYQQAVFGTPGIDYARYNMYLEGQLGNHDVTWERAKKWNVGTDMQFFGGNLTLTADYFQEKRDNILWSLSTVPELVASRLLPANIGKVDNYGYEIELGYKGKVNTFNYWLKGAYSFARNKIIYQDEATKAYEWMQRTGRPVSQYFGLQFEGFYNSMEEINDPKRPISQWEGAGLKPGDMKYKDLNGDGFINSQDIGPIGYSNWPEITYSLSMGGSWKGFDFSVLFQGADHVSVYYASSAALPFTTKWGPANAWNLERWTPERYAAGEKISYPRIEITPVHNSQVSSFWVQNGAYFRLKNVELGYRFSAGLLKQIGINSMRLYASGNNLLTFTNIKYRLDPDARELWGRTYPTMRVINAGLNLQF
jgi:TonB-linked SusC/RagA family outer membrane protein